MARIKKAKEALVDALLQLGPMRQAKHFELIQDPVGFTKEQKVEIELERINRLAQRIEFALEYLS